jgi:hypothetical protein
VNGTFNNASDSMLSVMVKNSPVEIKRDDVATVHEVVKKSCRRGSRRHCLGERRRRVRQDRPRCDGGISGGRRGSGSTRRLPHRSGRQPTSAPV